MAALPRRPGVRYPVLVPNVRGLARAEAAGVDAIAVFTAATDAFTTRNIRMTVDESLDGVRAGPRARGRARLVAPRLRLDRVRLPVLRRRRSAERAVEVAGRLLALGVDEVCFGDTIGVGVPPQVRAIVDAAPSTPGSRSSGSRSTSTTRAGTALANVAAGLAAGIRCFDASTGGTGGCPYAPGRGRQPRHRGPGLPARRDRARPRRRRSTASCEAARFIAEALGKPLATKVGQAGGWDPATGAATGRA